VVFDKTGTLTEGTPKVLQTTVCRPRMTAARCLEIAAALEAASENVLARAFAVHASGNLIVDDVRVVAGEGVEGVIDGKRWRIGSAAFVGESCADVGAASGIKPGTVALLGCEDNVIAAFHIGDELREDADTTIAALRSAGFRLVIASGDRPAAVEPLADRLGIDEWYAGLRPAGKLALLRRLRDRGEKVVMIGDGVNDAPVLAGADASIALDAGTALARATADAVVLGKRLGSVEDGVRIARRTQRIVRQNIGWAIAYNLVAVPLAASGMLAPWMAALGMSLSSLVVVLNALRVQRGVPRRAVTAPRAELMPVGRTAAA
jgi:Cu2+-exporting ATPase